MPFDSGDNESTNSVEDTFQWFSSQWRAGEIGYGSSMMRSVVLTLLKCPDLKGPHLGSEHEARSLLQLSRTDAFFGMVLETFDAKIVRQGAFFVILEPKRQIEDCTRKRMQRVKRNFDRLTQELQHVNVTDLSPEDRKRRNDELANAGSLRALVGRHKKD